MKRTLLFAAALGLSLSSQAWAGLSINDDVRMTSGLNASQGGSYTNGGGPFKAELFDDTLSTVSGHGSDLPYATFLTFCVQHGENLATWNNLDSLNPYSLATNRYLTGYAAWAYEKFVNSPLSSVANVGTANSLDLTAYQFAIWGGMVNLNPASNTAVAVAAQIGVSGLSETDFSANVPAWGNTVLNLLQAKGLDYATFAGSGWTGGVLDLHNYKIMNLSNGGGTGTQDQIIVPAGSLDVPEPASLAVWSILAGGAAGLSVARRRRATARGRWSNDNREAILSVIEGKHGH
jgi:hypothetical protein